MQDAGRARDEHAALAKKFTTSRMRETVAMAREVVGGNGVVLDYGVAKFSPTPRRLFYDQKITAGRSHHATLRALGNRWLEILWHCLTKAVLYDENIHVANRNRALGRVA